MRRKKRVRCFQVCREVRGTWFIVGYCSGWEVDFPNFILLSYPFKREEFHSPLGSISCRSKWTGSSRLPAQTHIIDPIRPQPWMEIEYHDLMVVTELVESLGLDLPEDGFRRHSSS